MKIKLTFKAYFLLGISTVILLLILAVPVLAASSDFLPGATEAFEKNCFKKKVSSTFSISCYLYEKVQEQESDLNFLRERAKVHEDDIATSSAKILELEERLVLLEATPTSTPTPTPSPTPSPTPTPTPTATPSPTPTVFIDNFDGPLNLSFWEFFSTNGGNYSFSSGSLIVPGGTSMFYIRSKSNPFPTSGPFEVEFGIRYTTVGGSGTGVAMGFQQQNGYDPSNNPVAYWQDSVTGMNVLRFGLTQTVIGGNPDLGYHVVKIIYDGDKYQLLLDGVPKYTSPNSATAKSVWFGNPFCCRTNWTGFNLDYIKITSP